VADALVFQVKDQSLALPIAVVSEVIRPVWPRSLPHAPAGCLGAVDLRGRLLPLVRLGSLLALEAFTRPEELGDYLRERMMLVVQLERPVAFVVDRVIDVAEIEPRAMPWPGQVDPALVVGTCVARGHRALLLDPAKLLGSGRGRLLQRAVSAVAAP